MGKDEFFRAVALRMCGTLDIEQGLYRMFQYLEGIMPLHTIALHHMDFSRNRQMLLATADRGEGGRLREEAIVLPAHLVRRLLDYPLEGRCERAESDPLARVWIDAGLVEPDMPFMYLRLVLEGTLIGAASFIGWPGRPFSEAQLALLTTVREPLALALSNAVRYRELLDLKDRLQEDNRHLQREIFQAAAQKIIGAKGGMAGVMDLARRVAPTSSPVLLLGETGTGKELVAGAIHRMSPRRKGPFVVCNCGAIPDNLVDSELFGHEKGAFTGAAKARPGRFERANGGTLFLDEVGELKPDAQVRLLRALQEKEVERVGGSGPIKVDIRVIAATHRDLQQMCRDGAFREDLLFRLSVFPLRIPPLRKRRQDIGPLIRHFLRQKACELDIRSCPELTATALQRLERYDWPGNVRELANLVERALILNRGEPLTFADLDRTDDEDGRVDDPPQSPVEGEWASLDEVMAGHIRQALQKTAGRVGGASGAAALLGVNPSTLRKRMRKLGIPFGRAAHYPA